MGELAKLNAADIKGKIVFYNEAISTHRLSIRLKVMAGQLRNAGVVLWKRHVMEPFGVMVRSIDPHVDDWPHTGKYGL